jgi:hypothetical protein
MSESPNLLPPAPASVQPVPQPRWYRRWIRRFLPALVTFAMLLAIGLVVAMLAALGVDLQTQHKALVGFRPWGAAIQGALIVLLGLCWPQVVAWARRRHIVQDWEYQQVLDARTKVMLMLLAYWLMIPVGPNALLRVFGG